jgi:hypothetical protein
MEDRSSRARANTVTQMAVRGLSANEIACALISMMARSAKGSNQRPDTLMQDRTSANPKKSSCNARPDHTFGSFASDMIVSIQRGTPASPPKRTNGQTSR